MAEAAGRGAGLGAYRLLSHDGTPAAYRLVAENVIPVGQTRRDDKGDEVQFTIQGTTYELTREQVESVLASTSPDEVSTYFVEVAGRRYPVKQVLAEATGLSKRDFDSGLAQRVLKGLGFEVLSTAPGARGRVPGSTRSFGGVEWGLAESENGYEEAPSGKLHLPDCAHGVARPVRVWSQDEAVETWRSAPDVDLRSLDDPGWCSDCAAIRGAIDPGTPADRDPTTAKTGRAERWRSH